MIARKEEAHTREAERLKMIIFNREICDVCCLPQTRYTQKAAQEWRKNEDCISMRAES